MSKKIAFTIPTDTRSILGHSGTAGIIDALLLAGTTEAQILSSLRLAKEHGEAGACASRRNGGRGGVGTDNDRAQGTRFRAHLAHLRTEAVHAVVTVERKGGFFRFADATLVACETATGYKPRR